MPDRQVTGRDRVRLSDGDITHAATLAAGAGDDVLHPRNLADAAGVRLSIVGETTDLRSRRSQLSENRNLERDSRSCSAPMTDYVRLGAENDMIVVPAEN